MSAQPTAPPGPPLPAPGALAGSDVVALRRTVDLCSRLSTLAAQDAPVAAVVQDLGQQLDALVAVVDTDSSTCVSVAPAGADVLARVGGEAALGRLGHAATRTRRVLAAPGPRRGDGPLLVAPVISGEEVVALLLVAAGPTDEATDELHLLVTEYAAMVCGILLGRERALAAAAGQARRDLFEALLLADRQDSEVENWARHLGISPEAVHRVATLGLDSPVDRMPEMGVAMEQFLRSRAPSLTVVDRGEEVVAIARCEGEAAGTVDLETLRSALTACTTAMERRFSVRLVGGIGDPHRGASLIARSYREARRAAQTSRLMSGLGDVVVFSDLGIHRLLARVVDAQDLREFARSALRDLVDEEAGGKTDYLQTLAVYFDENQSPQRSAKRLHVHPNTVTYRVHRIEEITGRDLGTYPDRLAVQVALEITRALGSPL